MTTPSYDVIVAGVGSMGAAACYHLSKRGQRVLGIEQFAIPHEKGAHAGQSRIIRRAYFEHPDYVPLLQLAYDNWRQLEQACGEQLYFPVGLLYSGKPNHPIISGVQQSAALYHIPLTGLHKKDVAERYPVFSIPDDHAVLWEPEAGFVRPERTIRLLADQAISQGAVIQTGEKMTGWKQDGPRLRVRTDKGEYDCKRLVITAGPWSEYLLPRIKSLLRVTRQLVAWVKPEQPERFSPGNFPCWMIADEEKQGCFYGFPFLEADAFGPPGGLKLAHHFPGAVFDTNEPKREPQAGEWEDVSYALGRYFPGIAMERLAAKVCLYTNTPDEHFIIDHVPDTRGQVIMACGFSGHGFKFVPAVGEILADLAITGSSKLSLNFLSVSRFTGS